MPTDRLAYLEALVNHPDPQMRSLFRLVLEPELRELLQDRLK